MVLRPTTAADLYSYHIGNSLTVDSHPLDAMVRMAAARGFSANPDWHIRSGLGLDYIWTHPDETSLPPRFAGKFQQALADQTWNVVTLQPNAEPLGGPTGAVARFIDFMNYAIQQNPANANAQFYIFVRWPDQGMFSPGYSETWNMPYLGDGLSTPCSADYYMQLLLAVRQQQPQNTKPVLFIPTGHVLAELDRQIRAGELSGISSITEFYRDFIHMSDLGQFVASATFYATIFHDNPTGLASPAPFPQFNQALLNQLETTIWNVVSSMPGIAIAPEPAPMGLLGLALLAFARRQKRGTFSIARSA